MEDAYISGGDESKEDKNNNEISDNTVDRLIADLTGLNEEAEQLMYKI